MSYRIFFAVLLALSISACSATYKESGVGTELYSPQTSADTNKLASYFQDICAQVNLVPSGTAVSCATSASLVQAGFNDIDQRCDRYLDQLSWQRVQAAGARSSLAAIGSSVTTGFTLAGLGRETVAFAAEALGLTAALYDASNNSMLAGLETNTILTIVVNRRTEFRRQFGTMNFTSTPQMVYALRTYLRICSPQTIVLDANTNAMYVAAGITPPSVQSDIKEQLDAITGGRAPVTAQTSAGTSVIRYPVACPKCSKLFDDDGYAEKELEAVQTALCVKADGDPGAATLLALQTYRSTRRSAQKGKVTRAEYPDIVELGCKAEDLSKGITNFFEAATMRDRPTELADFAKNLNALFPGPPQIVPESVTFNSEDLRTKVAAARISLDLSTGNPSLDRQITGDLVDKVGLNNLNK